MSVCIGTRVPLKTGVPPMTSGFEVITRDFMSVLRGLEQADGEIVTQRDGATELRTFGTGAQILRALGVRRMRVLSAPKQMHALSGFGLEVVEYLSSGSDGED